MGITLSGQSGLLLAAALLGFVLGAVYDIFRIIRVAARAGRAAVFLLDIIYWLICAAATFAFLLLQNNGKLRAVALIAEVAGAALYYYTIGAIVIKSYTAADAAVKRRVRAMAGAVAQPVSRFSRIVGSEIAKNGRAAGSFVKKESKLLKIRLKVHKKMMYNLIRSTKKSENSEK